MQHELHYIESLLNAVILEAPTNAPRTCSLKETEELIAVEQERIRNTFDMEMWQGSDAASYFALHQKILVRLVDTAQVHQNLFETSSSQNMESLALIINALENLLAYIRTDFPSCFNYRQRVPRNLLATWLKRIADNLPALEAKYCRAAGNSDLINIAFYGIKRLNSRMTDISYGDLEYGELIQRRLLSLDTFVSDEPILRQDICECLLSVNYNCPLFLKYYTDHFQKSLVTCETLTDRIDQASYYYKLVAQVSIQTHLGYELSSPDIRTQVLDWLDHELNYLHERQQMQSLCPSKGDALRSDFKVLCDLSVSQLAFLIRSFVETGVIQNKNTAELIRFAAKFVKTKKAESVSVDSFKTKFYNVESGTKDAVKKTLQSMLQYVNKN